MTKAPSVTLTFKTSGWVRIESGNALPATYAFVRKAARHMDRVSFGDEGNQVGSLAIKSDRVPAFILHARKNGLEVFWNRDGQFHRAEFGA